MLGGAAYQQTATSMRSNPTSLCLFNHTVRVTQDMNTAKRSEVSLSVTQLSKTRKGREPEAKGKEKRI